MMSQIKGKLVLQGKKFMVELPLAKGGTAKFPIPDAAKCFRDSDASDGMEVEVERDKQNRIIKVWSSELPMTTPTPKEPATPKTGGGRKPYSANRSQSGARNPPRRENIARKDLPKAKAKILGEPFHNPYTFIKFASTPIRQRTLPTLLTVDQTLEGFDRFTGVIELRVTTQSPLLSCHPKPINDSEKTPHKVHKALTIGNDVIVPASGVRGALRTLLTILTNGTLGYMDQNAFLVQGRDVKLGPRPREGGDKQVPPINRLFLGMVEKPGNSKVPGTIRLGTTRLVRLADLKQVFGEKTLIRHPRGKPIWIGLNENNIPIGTISQSQSNETPWRLKLSGRPVGGWKMEDRKREGVFKPDGAEISIPPELWAAYTGRNTFGDCPVLKRGDLVWLEPKPNPPGSADTHRQIKSADDIASIQWARWGKTGTPLKDRIPSSLHPDSINRDGLVDEVTNLFGQVAEQSFKDFVTSFAGRIQPENLVFVNAKQQCQPVTLAPLSAPHPGCLAFYRSVADPDNVGFTDMLRGYKVYRTTSETGATAPWNYAVQGVYNGGDLRIPPQQNVNKTVDLLPAGQQGILRLAVRALSKRELALVIQACHVPWRLGGGKPLGLGLCKVEIAAIWNEFGERFELDQFLVQNSLNWESEVNDIQQRVKAWRASQQPVPRLRYPRGVKDNQRGGHAWFGIHARPRMVSKPETGERESGLAPVYITGQLQKNAVQNGETIASELPMIAGQTLPLFNPDDPLADVLYAYDMIGFSSESEKNIFEQFEVYDQAKHARDQSKRHENQGKNRGFREREKRDRRG